MDSIIENIDKYVQASVNSSYMNIASFTLAVISIALAYIFYQKSRKVISLKYTSSTYTVLDDTSNLFENLAISFNNEQLQCFSITELIIKNSGNMSIKKSDIAPSNPLKTLPGSEKKILDHEIVYESNRDNSVCLKRNDDGSSCINFDFMNPEDRFSIRIIHTGKIDDSISVSGSVIGETQPFSNQNGAETIKSVFKTFMFGYLKLLISPRFRWVRILINYLLYIPLLTYAFYGESGWLLKLFCIFFGAIGVFGTTKSIFRKKAETVYDNPERMDHYIDAQMQDMLKQMKTTMSSGKSPNKSSNSDADGAGS